MHIDFSSYQVDNKTVLQAKDSQERGLWKAHVGEPAGKVHGHGDHGCSQGNIMLPFRD